MANNGYKITRSNYTLKKRHQTVSGGVVFERDFMTTTNLGGWDSGSIPYGENNFKMFYRATANAKKRPYQGEWLTNSCGSGSTTFLTAACLGNTTGAPEETLIKINPNYNSLLDFAYYGSCTELIKSTVNGIIEKFPAEMYSTGISYYGLTTEMSGGFPYILVNPFDIDLTNNVCPEGENELRYFLKSFMLYDIVTRTGVRTAISSVEIEDDPEQVKCGNFTLTINENNIILSKRFATGKIMLFTNIDGSIRPSEAICESFFDGLDDFGRILLNRSANPQYTAVLDTPFETERGVDTYQRSYTWPLDGQWNIAVTGEQYSAYIKGLLSIADFYDEYYTNNLWRMLTHDSIKAMDRAFSNPEKGEDNEDYNIGTSRLEGLFWAFGRQFDEIKRCIDNVKNTSKVSYDGNNNVPDYFLSDSNELSGWEVYDIEQGLTKGEETSQLFKGVVKGYSTADASIAFLRNLKLNSRSILAKKGTRNGIESVLGLFGMISKDEWNKLPSAERNTFPDYEVTEYIGVVTDTNSAKTNNPNELLPLELLNSMKSTKDTDTPDGSSYDSLQGLPTDIRYVETVNNTVIKYLVPWFSKDIKYDGNLYFQQKGGWGHHIIDVTESGYTYSQVSGFDETIKYIFIAEKVSDLINIPRVKLYNGAVAYVSTITAADIATYHLVDTTTTPRYFVLNNADSYYSICDSEGKGWQEVTPSMLTSDDSALGKKIYYIEHIIEDFKANNPHVGFGMYDEGEDYVETLRRPLKYAIDNDLFLDGAYNCDGTLKNNPGTTFTINGWIADNMKCWYFEPIAKNSGMNKLARVTPFAYSGDGTNHFAINGSATTFISSASTFDFLEKESTSAATNITADGMINTKRMKITFHVYGAFLEDFKKFLYSVVMPYLRQVLPSTVIFEYDIFAENVALVSINRTTGAEITDVDIVSNDDFSSTDNNDAVINFTERHPITTNEN